MKNPLLLAGLTLAVCFFANAQAAPDPSAKGSAPSDATAGVDGGDKAKEQLRRILAAFVTNDETTGRKLAQEFLGMQGLVAPQQIQAVQLLLRITNPPTLKDESPEEAKVRAEATKVAADLNVIQLQLNKIEAIAATMPKSGFTQGGQTHQRWIQLGNDRGRLWGERDKLVKRQGELSGEYAKAHSTRLVSVETELLDVASRFSAQGDPEGALAFCNTYLRKNPSSLPVAKKGQEIFEQRNAPPPVQGSAAPTAVTSTSTVSSDVPHRAGLLPVRPSAPSQQASETARTPAATSSSTTPAKPTIESATSYEELVKACKPCRNYYEAKTYEKGAYYHFNQVNIAQASNVLMLIYNTEITRSGPKFLIRTEKKRICGALVFPNKGALENARMDKDASIFAVGQFTGFKDFEMTSGATERLPVFTCPGLSISGNYFKTQ